jgi:inorganic pyrophosphatase
VAYHPWHDVVLPRFIEEPVPAIIEIPTGSKVKYELDKKSGLLLVDRILFSAVHYPANYGFIPRTYCDDGDPLDVLVLCSEQIQPLAIMRAKIIGVMKMRDDKGEDDKLIAVHADDPNYADYSDVSEIPPHRLRELQRFFQDYKALENKKVLVSAPLGRSAGLQVLRDAIRLYTQERERLGGMPPAAEGAAGRRAPRRTTRKARRPAPARRRARPVRR